MDTYKDVAQPLKSSSFLHRSQGHSRRFCSRLTCQSTVLEPAQNQVPSVAVIFAYCFILSTNTVILAIYYEFTSNKMRDLHSHLARLHISESETPNFFLAMETKRQCEKNMLLVN